VVRRVDTAHRSRGTLRLIKPRHLLRLVMDSRRVDTAHRPLADTERRQPVDMVPHLQPDMARRRQAGTERRPTERLPVTRSKRVAR
jgi:hypothetical protein